VTEADPARYCIACGTALEIRLVYGRERPVCPACGRVHFREPKVAAAALVVADGRVLLVHRVHVPEQGLWTLPAGFVEADEDPASAAVRECGEETGLQVRVVGLEDVLFSQEHARGAHIIIVYRAEVVGGSLAAHDDADAAGFFARDELPPLGFETTRRVVGRWAAAGG
jgi:ADP-ribose pyrophosphatase YjhB (NUDIX family)